MSSQGTPEPATGTTGTISIAGAFVVIERPKSLSNLLLQGLKGEKRIPFTSVTSVQFKRASALTAGYLQIGVLGGNESSRGILAATQDENTVMFQSKHQPVFEAMRDYIESQIGQPSPAAAAAPDPADQIRKLAELRDQGIVSETEFQAKKAQILERM